MSPEKKFACTTHFDERELDVLVNLAKSKEMTHSALIRHFFRMGHMVDHYTHRGYRLAFYNPETKQYEDPFDSGTKMSSNPDFGEQDLANWEDEGGAIPAPAPVTATDPACSKENCGHAHSAHFSCEVGSFCQDCYSNTDPWTWEHVFKP
jgi:hypothetical protein